VSREPEIVTFGCRLNAFESEVMRGHARAAGLDLNQDSRLLACARDVAPVLLDRHPAAAQAHVARWLGHKADFLKA
jgi:hypothetical protein